MRSLLNSAQSRALDRFSIGEMGMPSAVLMERAALAAADCADSLRPPEKKLPTAGILCGWGNNGGDGYACARILCRRGWKVAVQAFGVPAQRSAECARQAEILSRFPVTVLQEEEMLPDCDVIIDALFGTGLTRPVGGRVAEVLAEIDARPDAAKIAVDIPSGISSDTGAVLGTALHCTCTVSMGYAKPGHLLFPGSTYCGQLRTPDIGLAPVSMAGISPAGTVLEDADLSAALRRDPAGNKGTFGKVLVVAGSEDICGAAVLCASAALHSGCGMVRVFTHERNRDVLMQCLPESMCDTYDDPLSAGFFDAEKTLRRLSDALAWADAVVIGPGIGLSERARTFLSAVLSFADQPVIVDADALTLIAGDAEDLRTGVGPRILTPHLGEMARLTGKDVQALHAEIAPSAAAYAADAGVTCLLKDAVSVISDGRAVFFEPNGNDGMATAGSGDVLAGILGAVFARLHAAEEPDSAFVTAVGAAIHARAGAVAASKKGRDAMTAADLIEALPAVFRSLKS